MPPTTTRTGPEAAPASDPNPRIVLIEGVGLIAAGPTRRAADLSRDLYRRAIQVIRGADALGGYASLSDAESHAVEYWPLERYKLSLAPPLPELAGRVVLVTGGAGGIGRATGQRLADGGACVVAMDLDADGAADAVAPFGRSGLGVAANVTNEQQVATAFRAAVLEFGGVDLVVSNAGLASSAPITETSLAEWDRNHDVLARGYFLVAREAFRVLRAQATGGGLIFIASKNAVYAGRNAAAYSAAKAAELHLARCLAEEGGPDGIRVNIVNPDAVLRGSRIWQGQWKAERAAAYGIGEDDLDAHYRARTTLGVNIYPGDIAEAVGVFRQRPLSQDHGQHAQCRRRRRGRLPTLTRWPSHWRCRDRAHSGIPLTAIAAAAAGGCVAARGLTRIGRRALRPATGVRRRLAGASPVAAAAAASQSGPGQARRDSGRRRPAPS